MTSQYGCFASFSGRYVAKSWILDLDSSDCQTRVTTTTIATTTSTEAAVIGSFCLNDTWTVQTTVSSTI